MLGELGGVAPGRDLAKVRAGTTVHSAPMPVSGEDISLGLPNVVDVRLLYLGVASATWYC